jgi:predicted permease
MAFHLAERADDLVATGMPPNAAQREARRGFGNYAVQKEHTRDGDILVWLDTLVADVRYALRALRASPGFATVAILSLALGIGANTAIFSLIDAAMLRSLPVARPEELVVLRRDRDRVLLVGATSAGAQLSQEQRAARYRELIDRLRAVLGVTSVGAAAYTPLTSSWNTVIDVDPTADRARANAIVRVNEVSDGYFAALGTPLLAGREFRRADTPESPRVAIVSEALARVYLGGRAALGERIRFGSPPNEPVEIVGIVADTKQTSLGESTEPMVYFPLSQDSTPDAAVSFAIRAGRRLADLTPSVKAIFLPVDPRISFSITTLQRRVDDDIRLPRTLGMLAAFFGGLALSLAAIGLYGIMAYTVARRRSEIGIRVALGAARGRIVRMVLGDVARMVVVGVAIGVVLSLATARLAASLLYGVAPNDPVAVTGAALLLGAVALGAGALPARRAARLDPMIALRED